MTFTALNRFRCTGQALSEFLVLAVALVPLLLLIPLIAKYQDIAHSVQMASRYVAFEASVRNDANSTWKAPEQLAAEVRRRFFSNADAPIKTGDVAGNFLAHQNLFWRLPGGGALISNFDTDVSVSFGPGKDLAQDAAFAPAADGAPFSDTVRGQLGLGAKGVYTGHVSVKLANVPAGLKAYEPFDRIDLALSRHTNIVIDGWPAKDPQQVESRIGHPELVPVTMLRQMAPVVDTAIDAVEARKIDGPRLGQLEFWRDVVPPDRLK